MFEFTQDLIDIHNVTNVMEGYPQFVFERIEIKGDVQYVLSFVEYQYQRNQYIRLGVFIDRVIVLIEYHNSNLLKYIGKKYLTRSSSSYNHIVFEIKDESKLEEFIKKDIELILEYYINDAGVV